MSPGWSDITLNSAETCVKLCQACEHDQGSEQESRRGKDQGILLTSARTRQMMHRQMALDVAAEFNLSFLLQLKKSPDQMRRVMQYKYPPSGDNV